MLATRTFLFSDLRGFTAFVEEHGDADAAALIRAYRRLVRAEVSRTGGGEVKTEGDSFYIVFSTAHQALACGIAILHAAEHHNRDHPELPIHIGIGIHAGEPVPEERQFVGSAVNLAARLTQNAGSDELLISDVVRGLLRTSGLPPLQERMDIALKGIVEVPRVYAVTWRSIEYQAPDPRRNAAAVLRASTQFAMRRPVVPAVAGLILFGGIAFAAVLVRGAPVAPTLTQAPAAATAVLPPHGPLLFEQKLTPAGAQQVQIVAGNPQRDTVRFLGDSVELSVSQNSWLSIVALDVAPDDFVVGFAVRPVSGQGTLAFWFRGAQGRQDQVRLLPRTGELTVAVVQSFEADRPEERLFGPASRVSPTRDASRALAISAKGRDIVVYFNGVEIARATENVVAQGSMGIVVNAARDESFVVRFTDLRVFGP